MVKKAIILILAYFVVDLKAQGNMWDDLDRILGGGSQ
jgi:hypothetical protein